MARRPLLPCNVCFRPLPLQLRIWTSWWYDFGSKFDLVCIPGGRLLWKLLQMHIWFQIIYRYEFRFISFQITQTYRNSREMLNFLWIPIKIDWSWIYQDIQFVSPLSPIWSHTNLKVLITLNLTFPTMAQKREYVRKILF